MLSFLGRGKAGGSGDPAGVEAMETETSGSSNLAGAQSVAIKLAANLQGHTDRAWCVAWEPHGRFLATCSSDKTARLWAPSAAAGGAWVTVAELEGVHTRTVRHVSWSPCGRMLATCSFDASCAVWRERGGDWECAAVVEGHENEIKACAWSPSGTLLATCGRDKTVWIWEVQPGFDFECVAVLNGHTQDVKCVRWHPTEDVLVSTSYDDTIKVWEEDVNGDDWSCTLTLSEKENGHASTVWSAVFEPHGARRMATCSDDGKIVVWSATAGAPGLALHAECSFLSGHDRPVLSLSWGNRSGLIAAGGGDNSLRVFGSSTPDDDTDDEKKKPGGFREVGAVAKAHKDDVNCVAWHPTTPGVLASCADDGSVKIWNVVSEASTQRKRTEIPFGPGFEGVR